MIIAVDTGGTKTLIASFNKKGELLKKHRFATPKDTAEYLSMLIEVFKTEYSLAKVTHITIAVPGVVKDNILIFCPNLPWQDFDIASQLTMSLGATVPITLENDSNLAGLAEANAHPNYRSVLYATISTGVGISFVVDKKLSSEFSASESGHMLLEYDGLLQEWEDFASGAAIYETYGKYAHDITDKHIWEAIADKVSRGLLVLIPIFRPEVVVFGGGVGTYFDRFKDILEAVIDERLPQFLIRPELVEAKHPEEAVIYGCYLYANSKKTPR